MIRKKFFGWMPVLCGNACDDWARSDFSLLFLSNFFPDLFFVCRNTNKFNLRILSVIICRTPVKYSFFLFMAMLALKKRSRANVNTA